MYLAEGDTNMETQQATYSGRMGLDGGLRDGHNGEGVPCFSKLFSQPRPRFIAWGPMVDCRVWGSRLDDVTPFGVPLCLLRR